MEVMEEGNLMDRVPVLLQRDMQYYEQHQTVLQEMICSGVVGGTLDFPRSASFASVKIVQWWEDEYFAAYKKNSGLLHLNQELDEATERVIVKTSDPEKFVSAITKSAEKLLGHIHTLSQEALDHADLAVLTAKIGAAALIKNCLWVYLRSCTQTMCRPKGDEPGGSLKISYKQYSEMTEALAERLLDLHVRLLSLYIIQDADCLHWENKHPFFESERGSFVIQMWWLYLQGVKQDLWNSVPPNMAKRVFSGILNETLTILTSRYAQVTPSQARSPLVLVDISNLLLCVAEILPSICENGEAYAGLNIVNQSKVVRDIHCKCQELFMILVLRGAPLGILFRVARKGVSGMQMFAQRQGLISPWILFTLERVFRSTDGTSWITKSNDFSKQTAIALELKILLNSPQANWSLLLKLLLMRNSTLSSIIFGHLIKYLPSRDSFKAASDLTFLRQPKDRSKCEGFICGKECDNIEDSGRLEENDPIGQRNYQVVFALTYVILLAGKSSDMKVSLISVLEKCAVPEWASCLDKRQVWNQKRPPWLEAIIHLVYPVLDPIIHMLISAVQTGASIYQTMALAITSLLEMWDCLPQSLYGVTSCLSDIICSDVRPLANSVLIQVMFSALYTKLLEAAKSYETPAESAATDSRPQTPNSMSKSAICTMLAEASCCIDEDNKHTDAIDELIKHAKYRQRSDGVQLEVDDENATESELEEHLSATAAASPSSTNVPDEYDVESAEYIADVITSDVLTTAAGKRCMKILYNYLKFNAEWFLQQLNVSSVQSNELEALPGQKMMEDSETLLQIMFHIGREPFDQLLSGSLTLDYIAWLQTPMAVTPERAWTQISQRHEFQENATLSMQDSVMVAFITSQLKT